MSGLFAGFDTERVNVVDLRKFSNGGEVMNQAVEAYRGITAMEEFRHLEILRERARHDEAQAIFNAEKREREKWQGVVADKDALIAELQAELNTQK